MGLMRLSLFGVSVGLALASFSACRAELACTPGAEACECLSGGGCDAGLVCLSNQCVMESGEGTETSGGESTGDGDGDGSGDGDGDGSGDGDGDGDSSGDGDGDSSGDGDGDGDICGDGVLGAAEECDGTPGCTNCELDNYECNPLNDAGCPADYDCGYNGVDPTYFSCVSSTGEGVGGDSCSDLYDGQSCADGYLCVNSINAQSCGAGFCCTAWCDADDESFMCPNAGDACIPFFGNPLGQSGLNHLGRCTPT